ncbi:MAG: acetyltransferase [Fusobacteriaceae bacterium]
MYKNIIIVGAGGHAKVIIDILLKRNSILHEKNNIIFIFDDKYNSQKEEEVLKIPMVGSIKDLLKKDLSDFFLIIAIGNNKVREKIVKLLPKETRFLTLIHPTAIIGKDVFIGKGTVVKANVVVSPSTKIGDFCLINSLVSIEQDSVVEDFVHIFPNCSIYGENYIARGLNILSNTTTEHGAKIYADTDYNEHVKREV